MEQRLQTCAGLLWLTVNTHGTATGGLINTTIFSVPLRDQRISRPTVADVVRDTHILDCGYTDLHASDVCNDDAPFGIAIAIPQCQWDYKPIPGDDARWYVWFLDPLTRSWARFDYQPDTPERWPVHQFGPRRLFDEITTVYNHWDHPGRPPVIQWHFTITPHNQHITRPAQSDRYGSDAR